MPVESGKTRTGHFHGVTRSEISLKYLPHPDFLEFTLPKTHYTLVTNDGSALTEKVILQLTQNGEQVVVLNLPGVKNPVSKNSLKISDHTDAAIQEAIEKVHQKFGSIGSFIHLHPHFEFQKGNFTAHFEVEKEIVKTVFFLAKHLQNDLNALGEKQRANFLTVTRIDGQLGQGKRVNVSVVGGGLPGLVKCLNLEWSSVFCRALDIQPELSTDQISNQIWAELHDPMRGIIEVAFSEEGRRTTNVTEIEVPENQEIMTTVTAESVFLVSGGARGVTASCVIEMAKAFKCKFVLLGRSSLDIEVPAFAKNENNEGVLKRLIMNDLKEKGGKPSLPEVKRIFSDIIAKKEIDDTIAQIENYGSQVVYIQGDVTDIASYKVALVKATKLLGAITGIIHGAGRLADKYIQDKIEADFRNVLTVKLDGFLSLLKAVSLNNLDHLILFSSVAGFYGNVGQTDYAIANEILSRAAHLFKTNHPKTHVTAINWGAWDSGMVSGELKAQFEAAGVTLVNSAGGAAMIVNELNTDYADQPQVIIGGTLPAGVSYIGALKTHRLRRVLKLEDNPFLQHHVIQGNAVLPVVNAVGWMAQKCADLYPDFRVFKVENTKLFKGIVFDGSQKENYILELKEVDKSSSQIVFDTTVLSEGGKLPAYHYKARVTIINKNSKISVPTFKHQISGTYSKTDGSILYQDGSLFHGKYFQGIETIEDCTEKQMVISCKAPYVPTADQGQFPVSDINTFFTDIQYQGMVVWVQKFLDGAKSLPLQTDEAIIYKSIPFDQKFFVHIAIKEATDFKMVAKCTVYDEAGLVYMETNGATVTVSKQLVW